MTSLKDIRADALDQREREYQKDFYKALDQVDRKQAKKMVEDAISNLKLLIKSEPERHHAFSACYISADKVNWQEKPTEIFLKAYRHTLWVEIGLQGYSKEIAVEQSSHNNGSIYFIFKEIEPSPIENL